MVLVAPYDTCMREIIAQVAAEADMTIHAVEVMPDRPHYRRGVQASGAEGSVSAA